MNPLDIFGIGNRAIPAQNNRSIGVVTDVKKCWWFKVNTKPVRSSALDRAVFPHMICFRYSVGNTEYRGKRFLNHAITPPSIGGEIEIYYDQTTPDRYAVKI